MGMGKGPQGRGSIIFDHEGAPCTESRYHRHCRGRWRGVLSKGFGPDGRRRRYKVSGRTKQDVIEALKKKSEELDAGATADTGTVGATRGAANGHRRQSAEAVGDLASHPEVVPLGVRGDTGIDRGRDWH